jgi:hypothetical protein
MIAMTRCRSRRCVHEPLPGVILPSETYGLRFGPISAILRGVRGMLLLLLSRRTS